MFETFCKDKLAPLALRLALGLICLYHGFAKIMLMGGLNWNPALPVFWQFVLSWGEFVCGVMILLGFRCRLAAGLLLAMIVGNVVHFQGWHVFQLPLRTLEPTLMLLLVGMSLLFLGAGELSLDARAGGSSGATPAAKANGKKKAA
jgi:uncharacterized membrane protein YphA (DoxX/SURF4 family)